MTWYVTDKKEYLGAIKEGKAYRLIGKHYRRWRWWVALMKTRRSRDRNDGGRRRVGMKVSIIAAVLRLYFALLAQKAWPLGHHGLRAQPTRRPSASGVLRPDAGQLQAYDGSSYEMIRAASPTGATSTWSQGRTMRSGGNGLRCSRRRCCTSD
jgi:hypothetical protein